MLTREMRMRGVSKGIKASRIACGIWQERLGVVVIPECVTSTDLRDAWALALRIGKRAIITGPTAARIQGRPIDSDLILAISPVERHARVPGARLLRREPLFPTRRCGSLRLTNPQEAILDTLEALSVRDVREAQRLLDTALQLRWITPRFIESALILRHKRGQHVRALARLHSLARGGTQSHAERQMRKLLYKNKFYGWKGNHRVDDANGRAIASIDFAKVDLMIAIEVDGHAFHSDRQAFERDRVRDSDLAVAGWLVLRFTWEKITKESQWVVQRVRDAIRLRSARPPVPPLPPVLRANRKVAALRSARNTLPVTRCPDTGGKPK